MQAITQIAPATTQPAIPQRKNELDMNMFLRLLAAQLEHQNPLEPMSERDFFAQLAQLGTVQGMDRLQKSLEVAQASSLLGKEVTAVRPMTESASGSNELVIGQVVGLSIRNGEHWLVLRELNGGLVDVRMGAVRSVALPSAP